MFLVFAYDCLLFLFLFLLYSGWAGRGEGRVGLRENGRLDTRMLRLPYKESELKKLNFVF